MTNLNLPIFGRRMFGATMVNVAARFYNTAIALDATKAEAIVSSLWATGSATTLPDPGRSDHGAARGYYTVDGVAVIEVGGTLLHRFGIFQQSLGLTGYDEIGMGLRQALDDRSVRGIVLDVNSSGGEVCGCIDLVDEIFAARARKPILAILTNSATSAAYAIASAAHRVVVPRTGSVGGIGVLALMVDISKALTLGGIKVNVIQFGARKADGLEVMPLSPEARDRFQKDVNTLGNLFSKTVARNRGLDPAAVLALQGATLLGPAGVSRGLADLVASPNDAFERFVLNLDRKAASRRTPQRSVARR